MLEESSVSDVCYQKNSDISVLVSRDLGKTWEDHKSIVRTVNWENLTSPLAIPDYKSNSIILYFKRTHGVNIRGELSSEESGDRGNFVSTCVKRIDTNKLISLDAFVKYERPQYFKPDEPNDYHLEQFSQDGIDLRMTSSYVIAGEIEHDEVLATRERSSYKEPTLVPRYIGMNPDGTGYNGESLGFESGQAIHSYVDQKGIVRVWKRGSRGSGGASHPNFDPLRYTGENIDEFTPKGQPIRDRDDELTEYCDIKDITLNVSGIIDERCPCSTFSGAFELEGLEPGQVPVKVGEDRDGNPEFEDRDKYAGYAVWKAKDKEKWTLYKERDYWILASREHKWTLFKKADGCHDVCPPNGIFRMNCSMCNGDAIGTISESQPDIFDEEKHEIEHEELDGRCGRAKGDEEEPLSRTSATIEHFYSMDGGFTWKTGIGIKGSGLADVVYDDKTDETFVFYVSDDSLLFMKYIPSGVVGSPTMAEYLNSEKGSTPIFIAGDIESLPKDGSIRMPYPEDFIMDFRMSISPSNPSATIIGDGKVRFFYVDNNGRVNSGIWNGSSPKLLAKMMRNADDIEALLAEGEEENK
jgi:hypothetical protein